MSQDDRFSDKRSVLRQMKFPAVYSESLSADDLQRIQLPVLTGWIHATVAALLGFEDDVVSSLVVNTLQQHKERRQPLDPRDLQLTLTGFLEQAAPTFVESLWRLMLSAAKEPSGIPRQLLNSTMADMKRRQQRQQQQSTASVSSTVAAASSPLPASTSALVPLPTSVPLPVAASVSTSRPHRARSRFGPPLTLAKKTATTSVVSSNISSTANPPTSNTASSTSAILHPHAVKQSTSAAAGEHPSGAEEGVGSSSNEETTSVTMTRMRTYCAVLYKYTHILSTLCEVKLLESVIAHWTACCQWCSVILCLSAVISGGCSVGAGVCPTRCAASIAATLLSMRATRWSSAARADRIASAIPACSTATTAGGQAEAEAADTAVGAAGRSLSARPDRSFLLSARVRCAHSAGASQPNQCPH